MGGSETMIALVTLGITILAALASILAVASRISLKQGEQIQEQKNQGLRLQDLERETQAQSSQIARIYTDVEVLKSRSSRELRIARDRKTRG